MNKSLLFVLALFLMQFTVSATANSPANAAVLSDDCATATDLNSLLGGAVDTPVSSAMFNNDAATTAASDPTTGFECFGEPDGGGATPSLENTQWYTFTGDGETYAITTTDCGGTAPDYIDFGDTQIAIYSGADCDNLTPVACNEDMAGVDPNGPYPAGLNFETEMGVKYYMLVDGFAGSNGDYCIEFTKVEIISVSCAEIAIGVSGTDLPIVCFGETTAFTLADGTVIPTEAGVTGFRWVVSSADISGSATPFTDMSYLGAFGEITDLSAIYTPGLLNDGTQLGAGVLYFTPVVYGGGVGAIPATDFTNGCVETGASIEVELVADLPALAATSSMVEETTPPGSNGEASVSVTGGSDNYTYEWSNGETTASITGLTTGPYTVSINDVTGCVDELVETIDVGEIISNIDELEFAAALQLFPNPAKDLTAVQYDFSEAIDLQISISNTIGEVVNQTTIPQTKNGFYEIDLANFANGVYFINLSDGENNATRRLIINK